ncbi:MAG: IgGFc-binding protein [Flavobacteriales bacterium]|nr:IgGFc-binding protein [Flavobacteriales bacterium]
MNKRIGSMAIGLVAAFAVRAQATSSGTEFWVTYMENLDLQFNQPPYFQLVISSDHTTQGEVQIPATGFAIPFNVMAHHDTVLTLPTSIYYGAGDEAYFDYGIRLVADDPVSVYSYHHRQYFTDAAMVLPTPRLGTEYMVLAHEDVVNISPSEFVVLATSDATEVEITPSILTVGFRPPGSPFNVLLEQGQTFQVQAYGDLSGTYVRSVDPTKPIAVFSGARQARVNCQLGADDHLYQQIEPIAAWGTEYRVVPFKLRGGDEVRILGSADSTVVQLSGGSPITVDSGEVFSVVVSVPLTLTASAPVAVGQFNESQECNPANGDPAYLWLQPENREDQRAIWSSLTGEGTPSHYVNVVTQGEAGSPVVLLDGVDVSAQLAPMVGVPGVFWAQYDVTSGEHVLDCPTGCQATAYGFGDYNSYAFHLGYGTSPMNTGIVEFAGGFGSSGTTIASGGYLDLGRYGIGTNMIIDLYDHAGRAVRSWRSSAAIRIDVPEGIYIMRMSGMDGAMRTVRLLVIGS